MVWAAMKAVIRRELITVSAADNKARRDKRTQLQHQVPELEHIRHRTGAPRVWRQLEAVGKQLAGLDLDSVEYSILHLKHTFYVGDEQVWENASE